MERLGRRSYVIEAANGNNKFRRNRKHVKAAVSARALGDELSFLVGTNKSAKQNVDFSDENIDHDNAMPCTESPSKIHGRLQRGQALPARMKDYLVYYK